MFSHGIISLIFKLCFKKPCTHVLLFFENLLKYGIFKHLPNILKGEYNMLPISNVPLLLVKYQFCMHSLFDCSISFKCILSCSSLLYLFNKPCTYMIIDLLQAQVRRKE